MYNTDESFKIAYKPYDVVTDENGNVGFIQEVSINKCQDELSHQLKYAVNWMTGDNTKYAWFHHEELTVYCNIFVKIAESSVHPMGHNSDHVKSLMGR